MYIPPKIFWPLIVALLACALFLTFFWTPVESNGQTVPKSNIEGLDVSSKHAIDYYAEGWIIKGIHVRKIVVDYLIVNDKKQKFIEVTTTGDNFGGYGSRIRPMK